MSTPNNRRFYEILGVTPESSASDIKKAYFRLAREFHPDKNPGDPTAAEKFKELAAAYEVLSNPEKKSIYDQFGEDGLKEGGSGGPSMSATDFFESIFGGLGGGFFGSGSRMRRERRGEDVVKPIRLTLEELYRGVTKRMQLSKQVLCSACNGKGSSKPGAVKQCETCNGRGIRLVINQLAPGFIQQTQERCPDCHGQGETCRAKDRCTTCQGNKTVEERKVLEVGIDAGMRHHEQIQFHGEGDQEPDVEPGDVIFVVEEKPHDVFKRDGMDLHMQHTLTLSEALNGFTLKITTLDGRTILMHSQENDIIKPGDVRGIYNEGMPKRGSPMEKGRLFVHFDVSYPAASSLTPEIRQMIETCFPRPPRPVRDSDEQEEFTFLPLDPRTPLDNGSSSDSGHRGRHGGGVQCQTQ